MRVNDGLLGPAHKLVAAADDDCSILPLPCAGKARCAGWPCCCRAKTSARLGMLTSAHLSALAPLLPGFVRCIKPNEDLTPSTFAPSMVLQQLRTCGMVQAVRMMMKMYGHRPLYTDIVSGWLGGSSRLPHALAALPPREVVMHICRAFEVPTHEYAFGTTRVFFRAGRAVGLSAFCRDATSAAEAMTRSVVLQWKLSPHLREQAVARRLGAWAQRARTSLVGASGALEMRSLYVQADAARRAESGGVRGAEAELPQRRDTPFPPPTLIRAALPRTWRRSPLTTSKPWRCVTVSSAAPMPCPACSHERRPACRSTCARTSPPPSMQR